MCSFSGTFLSCGKINLHRLCSVILLNIPYILGLSPRERALSQIKPTKHYFSASCNVCYKIGEFFLVESLKEYSPIDLSNKEDAQGDSYLLKPL